MLVAVARRAAHFSIWFYLVTRTKLKGGPRSGFAGGPSAGRPWVRVLSRGGALWDWWPCQRPAGNQVARPGPDPELEIWGGPHIGRNEVGRIVVRSGRARSHGWAAQPWSDRVGPSGLGRARPGRVSFCEHVSITETVTSIVAGVLLGKSCLGEYVFFEFVFGLFEL